MAAASGAGLQGLQGLQGLHGLQGLKAAWALVWLGALAWSGSAAEAAPAQVGVVVRVTDGDSLWWRPDSGGRALRVRLKGIDAPEICQAHGPQSRDALAAMVAGQKVTLQTLGQDDHSRWLGRLQMPDGSDVAARMVLQGQAWSYRYKGDPGPYAAQEAQAVSARRGLHQAPGALLPRAFRQQHGPCS